MWIVVRYFIGAYVECIEFRWFFKGPQKKLNLKIVFVSEIVLPVNPSTSTLSQPQFIYRDPSIHHTTGWRLTTCTENRICFLGGSRTDDLT